MQQTSLNEQQKSYVETIATNSRLLLRIVNDILALSQDIKSIVMEDKTSEQGKGSQ